MGGGVGVGVGAPLGPVFESDPQEERAIARPAAGMSERRRDGLIMRKVLT
jgi:hypothetical protein